MPMHMRIPFMVGVSFVSCVLISVLRGDEATPTEQAQELFDSLSKLSPAAMLESLASHFQSGAC